MVILEGQIMNPQGFDLTNIKTVSRVNVPVPLKREQAPTPPPQEQPQQNPAQAMTMEQALTQPVDGQATNEDGSPYHDKLKKADPALHKQLWQIDKFASKPIPVQRKFKDPDTGVERLIWVDASGNNILDPDTGSVQLKPKA